MIKDCQHCTYKQETAGACYSLTSGFGAWLVTKMTSSAPNLSRFDGGNPRFDGCYLAAFDGGLPTHHTPLI